MATYKHRFTPATGNDPDVSLFHVVERPLYGSSRLGVDAEEVDLGPATPTAPTTAHPGQWRYELTDHLGNVQAVVTEELLGLDATNDESVDQWAPVLVSAQDYEVFGSLLPGRNYSSDSYRFGFNGQEKDNEVYGSEGTSYTAEFWQYDSRVARRWNLDPFDQISISNYATFRLNPIVNIDPNGAWVKGAGFFRNMFNSDNKINAQDRAKEIGGDAKAYNNSGGSGWNVSYTSNEVIDFGNGRETLRTYNVENFNKASTRGGYTMISPDAGGNNAPPGLPSGHWDVSGVQARASVNPGPMGHGSIKLPTYSMGLWEKMSRAFRSWLGMSVEAHGSQKDKAGVPSTSPNISGSDEGAGPVLIRIDTFYVTAHGSGLYRTIHSPSGNEYHKRGDTLEISIQSIDSEGNRYYKNSPYSK